MIGKIRGQTEGRSSRRQRSAERGQKEGPEEGCWLRALLKSGHKAGGIAPFSTEIQAVFGEVVPSGSRVGRVSPATFRHFGDFASQMPDAA